MSPICHAGVVWIFCHADAHLYAILSTPDVVEVEAEVENKNPTQLVLPSTISHYTTSHLISLHHITSYHIMLHHITSHHIISHHITSSGQSSVIREWQ